ncbi:Hypothetical predicted protein, partial [Olea europaea subsp. europaea]
MVTVWGGWHLAAVRGYGGFYGGDRAWDLVFNGDDDVAIDGNGATAIALSHGHGTLLMFHQYRVVGRALPMETVINEFDELVEDRCKDVDISQGAHACNRNKDGFVDDKP